MESIPIEKCIFESVVNNCKGDGNCAEISEKYKETIVKSSKARGDGEFVDGFGRSSYQCHKSCLKTYTSKDHINRFLDKKKETYC